MWWWVGGKPEVGRRSVEKDPKKGKVIRDVGKHVKGDGKEVRDPVVKPLEVCVCAQAKLEHTEGMLMYKTLSEASLGP